MVESDTSSRPTALQQNCLCFITTRHRRGSELAAKQSRTPLFKTAALRQSRGPFDSWASVCLNLARSRPGRRRGPCWKPPCPPRAARDPAAERRASAQREMRPSNLPSGADGKDPQNARDCTYGNPTLPACERDVMPRRASSLAGVLVKLACHYKCGDSDSYHHDKVKRLR